MGALSSTGLFAGSWACEATGAKTKPQQIAGIKILFFKKENITPPFRICSGQPCQEMETPLEYLLQSLAFLLQKQP